MPKALEAVRKIELGEIIEARRRIEKMIVRTPLIRLELGPSFPNIRLTLYRM